MRLIVRLLGVEVVHVEVDDGGYDPPRVDDIGTAHVVGFAPPVVEVREVLPDREP